MKRMVCSLAILLVAISMFSCAGSINSRVEVPDINKIVENNAGYAAKCVSGIYLVTHIEESMEEIYLLTRDYKDVLRLFRVPIEESRVTFVKIDGVLNPQAVKMVRVAVSPSSVVCRILPLK
ncbi:MAG: hypothetical protein V1661_01250 [bacterium]